MGVQWATDENMGHGFFVPIVAGYIIWKRKDLLLATPNGSSRWGLVLVIWAGFQALAATLGAELFTARLAFVLAVYGTVLFICGKERFKVLLFPLLLLLFMIPIPQILYARLTLSLQTLASELGEYLIGAMGIPVVRSGNLLQLPSQTLDIADASEPDSLAAFTWLSVPGLCLLHRQEALDEMGASDRHPPDRHRRQRNSRGGDRLAVRDKHQVRPRHYHEMEGYIVFVVALVALLLTHRVIVFAARKFSKT